MRVVFMPGKSHGQRSLVGYSTWGHKELDTTEQLSTHTHTHTHMGVMGLQRVTSVFYLFSFFPFSIILFKLH